MRLLAVDVGTANLGWAYGEPGSQPRHGIYRVPNVGRDLGWLLADIRAFLTTSRQRYPFTTIIFEGPVFYATNNPWTIRKVNAIGAGIELYGYDHKIPVEEQLPGPVRKSFLAPHKVPTKREAIKAAVIARCRQLGWSPEDDDDADALALLDYALAIKGSRLAAIRGGELRL